MSFGDDTLDPANIPLRPTEQLAIVTSVTYGYVDGVSKPMLRLGVKGLDFDSTVGLFQDDVDCLIAMNYIEDVFSLKGKAVVIRYDNGLFRFSRFFT